MSFLNSELPSLDELDKILSYLNWYNRDEWIKAFNAAGRDYGPDDAVFRLLQKHSSCYSGRKPEDAKHEYNEFYHHSKKRDGAHIGSLIYIAQMYGYKAPEKSNFASQKVANVAINPPAPKTVCNPQFIEQAYKSSNQNFYDYDPIISRDSLRVLSYLLREGTANGLQDDKRTNLLVSYSDTFQLMNHSVYKHSFIALLEYCSLQRQEEFNEVNFFNWAKTCYKAYTIDLLKGKLDNLDDPIYGYEQAKYLMDEIQHFTRLLYFKGGARALLELINNYGYKIDPAKTKEIEKAIEDLSLAKSLGYKDTALYTDTIAEAAKEAVLDEFDTTRKSAVLVPTGHAVLDEFIRGYRRGEMTFFLAHSGIGKTWYAIDAMRSVAQSKQGSRILFVSCEMESRELSKRLQQNISKYTTDLFLQSANDPQKLIELANDMSSIYSEFCRIHNSTFIMESKRGFGLDDVIKKIRLHHLMNDGLDLVIVDFLQIIDNDLCDPRTPKHEKIKDTSFRLAKLCEELHVPMLVLGQLNNPKNSAGSKDNSPTAANIAGSYDAIADAGSVLVVFESDETNAFGGNKVLRMLVGKNRHGVVPSSPFLINRDYVGRYEVKK